LLLYALPGKIKCSLSIFRVQIIQNFHQPFATSTRRVLVEQVELGHAMAKEVTQHNAGFLVPVSVFPDFVQALYRGVDDVA
jgi:hypothetical protein